MLTSDRMVDLSAVHPLDESMRMRTSQMVTSARQYQPPVPMVENHGVSALQLTFHQCIRYFCRPLHGTRQGRARGRRSDVCQGRGRWALVCGGPRHQRLPLARRRRRRDGQGAGPSCCRLPRPVETPRPAPAATTRRLPGPHHPLALHRSPAPSLSASTHLGRS